MAYRGVDADGWGHELKDFVMVKRARVGNADLYSR